MTYQKPPLDPAVRKRNRLLLIALLLGVAAVVAWSLSFLHKYGLNLEGGYH